MTVDGKGIGSMWKYMAFMSPSTRSDTVLLCRTWRTSAVTGVGQQRVDNNSADAVNSASDRGNCDTGPRLHMAGGDAILAIIHLDETRTSDSVMGKRARNERETTTKKNGNKDQFFDAQQVRNSIRFTEIFPYPFYPRRTALQDCMSTARLRHHGPAKDVAAAVSKIFRGPCVRGRDTRIQRCSCSLRVKIYLRATTTCVLQ